MLRRECEMCDAMRWWYLCWEESASVIEWRCEEGCRGRQTKIGGKANRHAGKDIKTL